MIPNPESAINLYRMQRSGSSLQRQGTPNPADIVNLLATILTSWPVIMAIGVIISGRFLSQLFKLSGSDQDLFTIRFWPIFTIRAVGQDVSLGLAGFVMTLAMVGFLMGENVQQMMLLKFGIAAPQFSCLSLVSSLITVCWSFALYVCVHYRNRRDTTAMIHDAMIQKAMEKPLGESANGDVR
jgi:NAD-dependent oxidoreductase involved in siderophore biosynthesis